MKVLFLGEDQTRHISKLYQEQGHAVRVIHGGRLNKLLGLPGLLWADTVYHVFGTDINRVFLLRLAKLLKKKIILHWIGTDVLEAAQTVKNGVASFLYFYDVPNRKSVIVTFEGVEEKPECSPTIVEVKGPNPIEFENGYVAFEDLPDSQRHLPGQKPDWGSDDDDDEGGSSLSLDEDSDDEEDDDDEDGKIVFDGTEDLDI